MEIRKCANNWVFCNGKCGDCSLMHAKYSDRTAYTEAQDVYIVKQYCRYCSEFYVGSAINYGWCEKKQRTYSRTTACKPNNCEYFQFVNCPTEYQDAFMETNGYHPRKPKSKEKRFLEENQISFL